MDRNWELLQLSQEGENDGSPHGDESISTADFENGDSAAEREALTARDESLAWPPLQRVRDDPEAQI